MNSPLMKPWVADVLKTTACAVAGALATALVQYLTQPKQPEAK